MEISLSMLTTITVLVEVDTVGYSKKYSMVSGRNRTYRDVFLF